MTPPLVSIVCLCYNHERFVKQAIESAINQTYPHVELIVVDDCSSDHSVAQIREALVGRPDVELVLNVSNQGNCRAFNAGFRKTKGEYIIDLAADDVLTPERVARGVEDFQSHNAKTGVTFSDAELIDEAGNHLGLHSDRFPHASIPQGDIYKDLLEKYFISSPTMMMRRAVLEQLGGYDESLAYEDFDFWIRSSREFHYSYVAAPLVRRRVVKGSLGKQQFKKGSAQLRSTLKVCEKAAVLNRSATEVAALRTRIRYEIRQCLKLREWRLAVAYLMLFSRISK